MKKYYTKKHLSLDISSEENWAKYNHKQERTYRNTEDNWKSQLLDMPNKEKVRLLFKYAYEGNLKMVKAIVNSGGVQCDIDFLDKDYNSALMYAIKSGKKEVVEFIAQKTKRINCVNCKCMSPLQLAVRKNRLDLVAILVDNGADIDILDKDNRTVIYDAVAENNLDMINALKLNGCSINVYDKEGISPLMYAVEQTNRQMAMFELIKLGANVNYQPPKNYKNALMNAIIYDNRTAMDILIKNGTNLNATDINGRTALMYCAKMGNREGIRVLISRDADVFDKDKNVKTAYDIAMDNVFHGSAEILAKAQKIHLSFLSNDGKIAELKKFGRQNKVENSCAK